jgi:hypothetical protein
MILITFMQGIYNYIPETNHFSWVYNVAAILQLCYGTCNIIAHVESFVILRLLLLLLLLLSSSSSSLFLLLLLLSSSSLELQGWVRIF